MRTATSWSSGTPLFEAAETRKAEQEDDGRGDWEWRASRFHRARSVLEDHPSASRVFLPLGEAIYDAGALAGPYTEVVDAADFANDGLMHWDPGPRRLDRLIMLTSLAERVGHPRAPEFRRAAEQAVASIQGVRLGATVQASVIGLG